MFNHKHYVPILKWKQGEYQAIYRLADEVKDGLTPLFEIPPIGFDFETEESRSSIDDHIKDFGSRLKAKWQNRPCFVDVKYIDHTDRMVDGRHFIEAVFECAREEDCHAIPVVSLSTDLDSLTSTASVIHADNRGAALRLALVDFEHDNLSDEIRRVLDALGIASNQTDLLVDLESSYFQPLSVFTKTIANIVQIVPELINWRTFTIAGTSYPEKVSGLKKPFEDIERMEWLLYQKLILLLGTTRAPAFGDYGVAHPKLVELDMRKVKPFAKLRYTSNDFWHIAVGDNVRDHGYSQYQQLCQILVKRKCFDGRGYSAGDAYIADCAQGNEKTGNLSTWVWVSTNRHLTKVVNDLASFHGP